MYYNIFAIIEYRVSYYTRTGMKGCRGILGVESGPRERDMGFHINSLISKAI